MDGRSEVDEVKYGHVFHTLSRPSFSIIISTMEGLIFTPFKEV